MNKELYEYYRELQDKMDYARNYNLIASNEVAVIDFSKLKPNEDFFPGIGTNTRYKTNMLLEKEDDIKKAYLLDKIIKRIGYGFKEGDYRAYNQAELDKFDEIVKKTRNGNDLEKAFYDEITKPENKHLFKKEQAVADAFYKQRDFFENLSKKGAEEFQNILEKSWGGNEEISSSIKLSEPKNLDEATKKWAEENQLFNKIWSGDDTKDMMRLLKDLDKKTWNEALEKNEFSKATIKIEIQSSKGDNVDIEAPLGKGIFQSGDLKKAIDFSSKNLDRNQISPELQEQFRKATATNEKGEYIDRVNHHNIERMFDGGFEKLAKSAESIGDEHLSAFVQGFANAYGFGRVQDTSEKVKVNANPEKSPTKEQSSSKIRQDIENIKKDTIEAAKKVLDKSKGKNEKTISKATDKSM